MLKESRESAMTEAVAPNPKYRYEPKPVDAIVVRAFNFDFPDDLDPKWAKNSVVRSHMFNGFSLTMPYLEPYLIQSTRQALPLIKDERLQKTSEGSAARRAVTTCVTGVSTNSSRKTGIPSWSKSSSVWSGLTPVYKRAVWRPSSPTTPGSRP